ncbi:response regulator transcription factor [Fulvivirgaceae bacterium BMA12]|uniref:Response regulator transcription factor n=1 Tax=Agaribacillus aureus TaxID=3051825 RepID=A0ABT8LGS1_9BACT|nr:response regulator transcription factor [Fulvivirgaceae bacterium BMA12]
MIKILLADDHQMFIDGIKSIIEGEIGIAVIGEANNGVQVIKAVENQKPDVILMDIRMPVMDGVAATRYLSKHFPEIPILALSMFDQEEDVIEMLEAGAFGYIIKNTGKQELIAAINAVMSKQHYYSKSLSGKIEEWLKTMQHREQYTLTKREREIIILVAHGKSSQQIANNLKISKFTVDTHRKNIHQKLGIKSNTGLVKYVMENLTNN